MSNQVHKLGFQLYNINSQLRNIINDAFDEELIDPETGVIPEEVNKQIDTLEIEKSEVIKNVILLFKELELFQTSVKTEKKRLAELDSKLSKKLELLENYVKVNIPEGEKIETSQYKIGWRKSDAIELKPDIDLEKLHKDFPEIVKSEIVYNFNKTEAKKHYKATGLLPEGANYVQRNNIQIK